MERFLFLEAVLLKETQATFLVNQAQKVKVCFE